MIPIHVDDVAGKSKTLEKIKYIIKLKFKIHESWKVKKFLVVYFEWVRDAKGSYEKMTV